MTSLSLPSRIFFQSLAVLPDPEAVPALCMSTSQVNRQEATNVQTEDGPASGTSQL